MVAPLPLIGRSQYAEASGTSGDRSSSPRSASQTRTFTGLTYPQAMLKTRTCPAKTPDCPPRSAKAANAAATAKCGGGRAPGEEQDRAGRLLHCFYLL